MCWSRAGPYREIPTVQTDLEQLQERLTHALDKFEKIDFQALVVSITDAANSIKTLTGSPELKATLESLKGTVANLNQAVISARALLNNANAKVGPLVADIRESSDEANKTMKETRAALVSLQQTLDPDAPLAVHLNQTLDSLDRDLAIARRVHRLSAAQSGRFGPRKVRAGQG